MNKIPILAGKDMHYDNEYYNKEDHNRVLEE
jgi:hypothetical protein